MKLIFGLRAKILLFSSFLFAIPYLGYQYVWELETYLRIGQEQTLVGTARSVATALHERPALFAQESAFLQSVRPGKDLFAHAIDQPIRLDGQLQDWSEYAPQFMQYDERHLILQNTAYSSQSLHFTHMVGQFGRYLYVMFDVNDDVLVYRNENMLSIHKNDFIQIAMRDEFGQFQRYIVAPYQAGWVNAYQLKANDDNTVSVRQRYQPEQLERRIQGFWREKATGYQVELRFPLSMLQGNIAFAISDVDDITTRQIRYSMGTANPEQFDALGTVIVPSPEIEQIVQGLAYADARVWIVDKHQRVLARSGDIQTVGQLIVEEDDNAPDWWQQIEETVLLPLYYTILTKPPEQYIDDLKDAVELAGQEVQQALQGQANTQWRVSGDKKAVILTAAHPIFVADEVMGAVVVEQTTHGIRTLRNQALEKQFNFFIAVIVLGTLALFLLASRISFRIRKLRNATESAIDKSGKITGNIDVQSSNDEIGDLSRGFAQVLSRLGQYNQYLEKMASRLSHELRTPVAVVKSSLENLELIQDKNSEQAQVFVTRAQEGLVRLSHILNSMSEATRLEHVIEKSDKQYFDLVPLLNSYVDGYVVPEHLTVDLAITPEHYKVKGSPELMAQMLDKIMANAVDFAYPGTSIDIALDVKGQLSISNVGPVIAEQMQDELFNSMVSIRSEESDDKEPHLGLGLYLAKLIADFHQFNVQIHNTKQGVQVMFSHD